MDKSAKEHPAYLKLKVSILFALIPVNGTALFYGCYLLKQHMSSEVEY